MHEDSDARASQVQIYRHRLDALLREGRRLQAMDAPAASDVGGWQRDCTALISGLSGGDKAHWLSRAYSEAFLVRPSREASARGGVAADAPVDEILTRIVSALELAVGSLAQLEGPDAPTADSDGSRRFAFLDDPGLRSGVVQADAEADAALARGALALSLVSRCSVLESIITDALERAGDPSSGGAGAPPLHERPFEQRIADAECARVISAGCRRLPDVARRYREILTDDGDVRLDVHVSESDAVRVRQVLRVIVRDLAPGR